MKYLILSNSDKYSLKSQKKFSKKNKMKVIQEDIEVENVKDKQGLKNISLLKKYIQYYDKILITSFFITPFCDNFLDKIPEDAIGFFEYDDNQDTKNLLDMDDKPIDTSCIVVPKIVGKYLTDELLKKKMFFFDYDGYSLLINYIIQKYKIKTFKLDSYVEMTKLKKEELSINVSDKKMVNISLFKNTYIRKKYSSVLYNHYYKKKKEKKLIALTINNKLDNIYSNGINLNVYLWYDFVKLCGYDAVLISHDCPTYEKKIFGNTYNIIDAKEVESYAIINNLYAYLNVGLSLPFLESYLKNKCKLILICLGSTYYNDLFNILSNNLRRTGQMKHIYDEVWISPHFEYSIDYIRYRYQTEVYVCPYFWEPYNLKDVKPLEVKGKLKVGIVESNINVYKHCLQPIIICDKGNEYVEDVMVFNGESIKNNEFFVSFVNKTKIFKEKKITFEPRLRINNIFEKYSNCIISFSDNCDLNYVTFECLYLGIPIIHNSPMLKNYGYYYDKFDTEMGKEKLKEIYESFNKKDYLERNKPLLNKYSIKNKEYKEWFTRALRAHPHGR